MSSNSFTDLANSTAAPLAANGVFKGKWISVESLENIMTVAKSDVDGTLYMEFYYDTANRAAPTESTTADSSIPFSVQGGVAEPPHQLAVARGWYRTRYVNGSTSQTTFQLVTRPGVSGPIIAPANISVAQNQDASVVRVISEEMDISQGKRRGVRFIKKFGRNADVDAANTDISFGMTGAYTGFPTSAAETFEVSSSSGDDVNTTGSGAWSVRCYYLNSDYEMFDSNGDYLYFDVNLNGTNWVDSGVDGMRVWRAQVMTSASSNQALNVGTITIRWDTTTSAVFINVPPSTNQSESCAFTIPAGYKGYLTAWDVEMAKTASANGTVVIWQRDFGKPPRYKYRKTITQASPVREVFWYSFDELGEKTDIALRIATISTTNISFSGDMALRLVKQ